MKKTFPAAFSTNPRPPIALQPVPRSSQIKAIGYDAATKTAAVQFSRGTGAIYHYANVEQEQFDAFKGAESVGKHFEAHFRQLPFEKFPPEAEPEQEAGTAAAQA